MDSALLWNLVGALGPTGFIMWLAYRTTSHIIPKLAERLASTFKEASENQRQDFKETLKQQREDFGRMLTREQEVHESQTDRLVEAIKEKGPQRAAG